VRDAAARDAPHPGPLACPGPPIPIRQPSGTVPGRDYLEPPHLSPGLAVYVCAAMR